MERIMKKKILCIPMLSLLLLTGCKEEAEEVPELLEPVAVKIDMAMAQTGEIYDMTVYSGEVVPAVEELYFLADGQLKDVYVMMGDIVEEGQLLASLDEEELTEEIEDLEEEITYLTRMGEFSDRIAADDIEIARGELEYMHALGDFGRTSWLKEIEIQEMELALEEAKELRSIELQQKQKSLNTLKNKTGKGDITAPFSGRIVYISEINRGDAIQGYTPVIYIADDSVLSLSTDYISESSIRYADRLYAKIGSKDYEISYVPYEKEEMVRMTLAGEEMKTQFSIDSGTEGLVAGQYAAVVICQSYKENVLVIPVNALYRDGGGQYVYKQVDGERVRCSVKTGMVTDTKAEIEEGLEEGDIVYVQE